jgi:hypothetical protein
MGLLRRHRVNAAPTSTPHHLIPFEGEQHGFRRAENIKRSLEEELLFYRRIFGFEGAV